MDHSSKPDESPAEQVVTTGIIVGWAWAKAPDGAARAPGPPTPPAPPCRIPPPLSSLPGSARYPLRRTLGVGGMGEVQLCRDLTIGREVALKRMLPAQSQDASARARFVREAQVQGQLEHPAIVPVYDLAVDADGSVFFTMKRLRGRTLEDILLGLQQKTPADCSAFPLHRLLQNFATICLAIEFAHSRGVLHRDLKPANIMLGDFGEIYVLDWGLAKIRSGPDGGLLAPDSSEIIRARAKDPPSILPEGIDLINHAPDSLKTAQGMLFGTLSYMSPEQTQLASDELDARSDVFTLGAILFEILTLERLRPRGAPEEVFAAIQAERPVRPSERAPQREIPPELDQICLQATARDPTSRYQSARALHQAVERYLSGERDTALRREMAAGHAKLAGAAVERALAGEPDANDARRTALTEVGRALALDPENDRALGLLHRLLSEPPRRVPPEVEQNAQADLAVREQLRLRSLVLSGSAALVLIPLLILMGVRNWPVMIMLVIFGVTNIALRWWVSYPTTPIVWRYVSQLVSLALMFCLGRILGPLLLVTMPLTVHAMVHSISGQAALRRFVLLSSCLLLVGMFVMEQLGWLLPSYHFVDGGLLITPNLASLPPTLTLILLLSISMLYILLPAVALSRLPVHLAEVERRLAVHAWQLRQLLPESSPRVSGSHGVTRAPGSPP